jgi:hypothetical protein
MKIRELIDELKEWDKETEVLIEVNYCDARSEDKSFVLDIAGVSLDRYSVVISTDM